MHCRAANANGPTDVLVIRVMWRISQKVCYFLGRSTGCLLQEANRQPLADIISTVEFDHTGNYLATGDKGGRVVLFERNETVSTFPCTLRPSRPMVLTIHPRKKPVNINSTPSSSRTSPSLIT